MANQTWPPPQIDVINRVDTTPEKTQHPKDHNDLQVAVNSVITVLGPSPYGHSVTLTDELARLDAVAATPGPAGPTGATGPTGAPAPPPVQRFYGQGPPGVLLGARAADEYLDTLTGDLYILQ